MTDKAPPYPADVRAKGWRFEIDMETIKVSDTWLRARTGALRGMLLLLWSEAWMQTPCGSLPDDDELIALILDMDDDEFAKRRAVLMRGWWRADDGRLYHETITERVLAMMAKRRSDADRQANRRATSAKSKPVTSDKGNVTSDKADVTRDGSDVTCDTAGRSHESDTGTGTGTSESHSAPNGAAGADASAAAPAAPAAPAEQTPAEPPARELPCDDLIPRDDDLYGTPGNQTAEQKSRELWHAGKELLILDKVSKASAGSFIGGLAQKYGKEIALEVVRAAIVERPAETKSWMTAACERRAADISKQRPVTNITERRVATMAGLKNTGGNHVPSHAPYARDSSIVDAEVRVVGRH